jgi:hypothetical protein
VNLSHLSIRLSTRWTGLASRYVTLDGWTGSAQPVQTGLRTLGNGLCRDSGTQMANLLSTPAQPKAHGATESLFLNLWGEAPTDDADHAPPDHRLVVLR